MNRSDIFDTEQNPVIKFLKGLEFEELIKNIVRTEMGGVLKNTFADQIQPLTRKVEEVENEVKLLRYMNGKLVKKLREYDSAVDDSEIASLLSEVNSHTDSDEESHQNEGISLVILKYNNKHF